MTKKRLKKGEGQKIVLNAIENWKTRVDISRETGLNYTTIDEALKVLVPSKVEKKDDFDNKSNKIIKFRNKQSKDMVNPRLLKLIMKNYNSENPQRKEMSYSDMDSVCGYCRIIDEEFINFLIDESFKDRKTWDPLACLARRLVLDRDRYGDEADREKRLLRLIYEKTGKYVEEEFFDRTKNLEHRDYAIQILDEMLYPKRFDIALKFFQIADTKKVYEFERWYDDDGYRARISERGKYEKKIEKTTEFNYLFQFVEPLIMEYSKINNIECRKKLYDLLDSQKDRVIKKSIMELLHETRFVSDEEKKEEESIKKMFGAFQT